jgi:hypothetical protein
MPDLATALRRGQGQIMNDQDMLHPIDSRCELATIQKNQIVYNLKYTKIGFTCSYGALAGTHLGY